MNRKMSLRHPGLIFRDEVIKAHGLTVTNAAELLKVTRPALSNVLNGHADISPEMSLRISKVFGGTAEIWMNLQTAYNLDQLRSKVDKLNLKVYKTES
jgi:addiction module HigA family antidote